MWSDDVLDKFEYSEYEFTMENFFVMADVLASLQENTEKELLNFYDMYGSDGIVTYSEARKWVSSDNHTRRLLVLFTALDGIFDTTVKEIEKIFKKLGTGIFKKEIELFQVDIPTKNLLNHKWGADGLSWNDRLWNDKAKWISNIEYEIKNAIVRRATSKSTLKALDRKFISIEKALKNLTQTESTAWGSAARNKIFHEMGVDRYRFYSRADERTCERCGSLHGQVFPVSQYEIGVTAAPIHGHCRCWEVPVLD